MCGVWVALEDMDMDNGPLVYYPGSHKLPEITLEDVGPGADEAAYSEYIAAMIERLELEAGLRDDPQGPGAALGRNLLHGGSPQRDMSRTRHSQVTHFFFEGCKYWAPLLSDGATSTGAIRSGSPTTPRARWQARAGPRARPPSVPVGATVLVASRRRRDAGEHRGPPRLALPQRRAWRVAWLLPGGQREAIDLLEDLRAAEPEYLVLPETAFWWLDHYGELAQFLERSCDRILSDESCVIYALPPA